MLFKARSAAVYGIDAHIIDVEVDFSGVVQEKETFSTVGLPDAAVRESRDRVRSAIKNSGFDLPPTRITINLAPADLKKEGSGFDLPIAIGILGAYGGLAIKDVSDFVLVGELGLDGSLRAVQGMLPIAIAARAAGIKNLVIPAANAREAAVVEGVNVYPVNSLLEVRELLNSADKQGTSSPAAASSTARPAQRSRRVPGRLPRRPRPARRQARARSRRRRRPQHPDDRPARLRQDHARQAPAVHPRAAAL
jgi:magnesium chelatase family protein